jgi:diguanylate cyclase (GGDEF)-like protein
MAMLTALLWILPLGCALIAAAFALVWVHQGRRGSGGYAATAFACAALTSSLDISRDQVTPLLVTLIVPLQWAALLIIGEAFLNRVGKSLPRRAIALAAVAPLLLHGYFFLVAPQLGIRNLIGSIVAGGIFLLTAWLHRHARRDGLDRAILATLITVGLFYLARTVPWLIGPPMASDAWLNSVPMILLYMGNMLAALSLALLLMLAIGRDLMESHMRESRRDALTGIGNRRLIDDAMAADAAATLPIGAVVMIDLDHFKAINDRHGHAAGDQVLTAIAEALDQSLGKVGPLARVGGEEFMLLVPEVQRASAPLHALAAHQTIAATQLAALPDVLSASVGLALRGAGEPLRDTMRRADLALYRAKAGGRNRVITAADEGLAQAVA